MLTDVSKSMGRGNDRRLDRMAATMLMLMEALQSFAPHKFDYAVRGHDGDSPIIPFVEFGHPPRTDADRLAVLEMLYYNVGSCGTGDHTEAAAQHAIREVLLQPADDYFVFLLSDANLADYGVSSRSLANILLAEKKSP